MANEAVGSPVASQGAPCSFPGLPLRDPSPRPKAMMPMWRSGPPMLEAWLATAGGFSCSKPIRVDEGSQACPGWFSLLKICLLFPGA